MTTVPDEIVINLTDQSITIDGKAFPWHFDGWTVPGSATPVLNVSIPAAKVTVVKDADLKADRAARRAELAAEKRHRRQAELDAMSDADA